MHWRCLIDVMGPWRVGKTHVKVIERYTVPYIVVVLGLWLRDTDTLWGASHSLWSASIRNAVGWASYTQSSSAREEWTPHAPEISFEKWLQGSQKWILSGRIAQYYRRVRHSNHLESNCTDKLVTWGFGRIHKVPDLVECLDIIQEIIPDSLFPDQYQCWWLPQ